MEVAVMAKPPNYRQADTPGKSCETCDQYYKLASNCRRYNTKVGAHMVCRTWSGSLGKGANTMDIEKLSDYDLAYLEGLVEKCAEIGVDPELLLEKKAIMPMIGQGTKFTRLLARLMPMLKKVQAGAATAGRYAKGVGSGAAKAVKNPQAMGALAVPALLGGAAGGAAAKTPAKPKEKQSAAQVLDKLAKKLKL